MKDYHDLYFKCDVLLLADFFWKLRKNIIKNYEFYPSHYLNAPALSWDAMLNITKVKLELISDLDMYLFFEKWLRGWVSYVLIDIVKTTISIWNLTTQSKNQNILYT